MTDTAPLRKCCRCGETKPLELFEKKKGKPMDRGYRCLACAVKRTQGYYAKNVAARREYGRQLGILRGSKSGVAMTSAERMERYPDKEPARRKLRVAVARGHIKKPDACVSCGRIGRVHGHHYDYAKPLDVEWLCPKCHGLRHRKPLLPPEDSRDRP